MWCYWTTRGKYCAYTVWQNSTHVPQVLESFYACVLGLMLFQLNAKQYSHKAPHEKGLALAINVLKNEFLSMRERQGYVYTFLPPSCFQSWNSTVVFVAEATSSFLHVGVICNEGCSARTEVRATAFRHVKASSKSPRPPWGYWKTIWDGAHEVWHSSMNKPLQRRGRKMKWESEEESMSARKLRSHVGKKQAVSKGDVYSLEVRIQRASAWHESALQPLDAG